MDVAVSPVAKAELLAPAFTARAGEHDRSGSFPFENFQDLSDAGLLSLTVPRVFGGSGAGLAEASRVVGIVGKACPSTALVLTMHYLHHLLIEKDGGWPAHLARKLAVESVDGLALVNALRVEPEQGSPSRGGLPATTAHRTATGWRISGRKIYSTGSPILKYYAVWAKTDEPGVRVGIFLVPAGLPGTEIIETWDHLGLRASGSHDVVFSDVVIPLDHEVDLRPPGDWLPVRSSQPVAQAAILGSLYDGVARAARDWLVTFVQNRAPSSLGAPLATLARVQEIVGDIEIKLAVNARLIGSIADDFDSGVDITSMQANIVKSTVTNNAIAVVEQALSLAGNHGLSRKNPLERHFRDVLCGRIHTPQDDSTRISAGRLALGL